MNYKEVFANLKVDKLIREGILDNSLSHCLLLSTEDRVLRVEFAKHVAKMLLNDCEDCGVCNSCKKVEARSHPDYYYYPKKEDGKITSDDVEEIVRKAYLRPIESKNKVIVIYGIELLVESIQNKLLKVVEEPPKNTYFIIAAKSEKNALSTIRSRSTVLNVESLPKKVIYQIVCDKIGDREKAKIIAENANGSIDKALEEVSSGNTFQKLSQGIKIIKSLKSSKNTFEVAMMFEGYKEEDLFQIMQNVYRDMLAIKCKNTDVLFYKTEKDAIMGLAQEYSIMALIESIEEINKAISLKSANVSKNANVDGLLLNLLEVKYNCQK
ncbi:MAG: hypothetical protein IJ938_02315 [Clostridia bacterium]|nr:hypothetical protein [Clostridia bacterium]MBR2160129.1 hypothetical protein [Clostridia bacterium]